MGVDGWTTSDYVTFGDPASLPGGSILGDTEGTVCVSVYRDRNISSDNGAFYIGDSGTNDNYIRIQGGGAATPLVLIRTTSTVASITSSVGLTAFAWETVIITGGTGGLEIFVNNSSGGTDSDTTWLSGLSNVDLMTFGNWRGSTPAAWQTPLACGAYWDVKLGADDRQALTDGVSPYLVMPGNLKAFWNGLDARAEINRHFNVGAWSYVGTSHTTTPTHPIIHHSGVGYYPVAPSAGGSVSLAAAGTITVGGAAELRANRGLAAAGTITVGGDANVNLELGVAAAGTITWGGDANLTLGTAVSLEAAGTMVMGGAANLNLQLGVAAAGTITVGGAANVSLELGVAAAGTIVFGGAANLTTDAAAGGQITLFAGILGNGLIAPSGAVLGVEAQILATRASNLIGYYKCDEASGSLADSSGNGNTLTVLGSGHVYGVAGHEGDAVDGSGTGGWSTGAAGISGGTFNPSSGFTFAILFKPPASTNTNMISVARDASLAGMRVFGSLFDSGGEGVSTQGLGIGTAGGDFPNSAVPAGDWHHMVCRMTNGGFSDQVDLFVDGAHMTTSTGTFTSIVLDTLGIASMYINGADDGSYYDGPVQHAAFWDVELTDGEISTLFASTGL